MYETLGAKRIVLATARDEPARREVPA